ncbi:thermonuclease family protein [Neisseriaceae bacterium B1]
MKRWLCVWVMGLPLMAMADIACRPVAISDGDTFTCLTDDKQQVRVRLNQIDAPEKSQAFGQKAKAQLSGLIWQKNIRVVVQDTDRYGRKVADVFVGHTNVNKQMVASGYAWAYRQYLSWGERSAYLQLEAQAKAAKRGLWHDPNPIYPSAYRHGR